MYPISEKTNQDPQIQFGKLLTQFTKAPSDVKAFYAAYEFLNSNESLRTTDEQIKKMANAVTPQLGRAYYPQAVAGMKTLSEEFEFRKLCDDALKSTGEKRLESVDACVQKLENSSYLLNNERCVKLAGKIVEKIDDGDKKNTLTSQVHRLEQKCELLNLMKECDVEKGVNPQEHEKSVRNLAEAFKRNEACHTVKYCKEISKYVEDVQNEGVKKELKGVISPIKGKANFNEAICQLGEHNDGPLRDFLICVKLVQALEQMKPDPQSPCIQQVSELIGSVSLMGKIQADFVKEKIEKIKTGEFPAEKLERASSSHSR